MPELRVWLSIGVIALVTAAIRFLPFLLFGGKRKTPAIIERLGRVLPFAVMGLLVVYCLRTLSFTSLSGFVPATVACLVVVLLHIWRRNTLLSILGGTLCYMILVQTVF